MRKSVIIKLLLCLTLISFYLLIMRLVKIREIPLLGTRLLVEVVRIWDFLLSRLKMEVMLLQVGRKSKGTGSSDVWVLKLNENGNLR